MLTAQFVMIVTSSQEYFQDLQDQKKECKDPSLLFQTLPPLPKIKSQVFIVIGGIDDCLLKE